MFFLKKRPQKLDIQSGYDRWAPAYSHERNPIKSFSDEMIMKMLPNLNGKRVIDAGCGCGYFCRYAEQQDAKEIVGIDFSAKMIEQANKICKYTKFRVADIQHIDFQESSADVVISALVLGHLKKIEPIITRLSGALARDGVLVISDFHPFLSLKGQKRTFRAGKENFEVPHYVHMLNEYINLLTQCGLTIMHMEEPIWKDNPVIFALKARKI